MLLRTHTAISIFLILLFLQYVQNKIIFVLMVLLATMIPDLDSSSSSYGRHTVFRPMQFFVEHRGIFHSFTIAFIFSVLISVFWPIGVLGFFLGYSGHLISDSFTKEGIQPFWPFKAKCSGPLYSAGRIEEIFFLTMIFVDIFIFLVLFVFGF